SANQTLVRNGTLATDLTHALESVVHLLAGLDQLAHDATEPGGCHVGVQTALGQDSQSSSGRFYRDLELRSTSRPVTDVVSELCRIHLADLYGLEHDVSDVCGLISIQVVGVQDGRGTTHDG